MMTEVLWTRMYILTLGSSVYAFSIVLFTFWADWRWGVDGEPGVGAEADRIPVILNLAAGLAGSFIVLPMPWNDTTYRQTRLIFSLTHVLQFGVGLVGPCRSDGMVFPAQRRVPFARGSGGGLHREHGLEHRRAVGGSAYSHGRFQRGLWLAGGHTIVSRFG